MGLSNQMIAIEINDHILQFIELQKKGKEVEMTSFNRIKLVPGVVVDGQIREPDELEKNILQLFEEANPKTVVPKNVAILMPSKKVFSHIFHFPKVRTDKDLPLLIATESETIIPLSLEELYWDYRILNPKEKAVGKGKERGKKRSIIFGGIEQGVADDYANLFLNIGIQPILFGTNLESLYYALRTGEAGKKTALCNQFIIEFGAYSIDFLLMENNTINYFLSSNKGIGHLTKTLSKEAYEDESALFDAWKNLDMDDANLEKIKLYIKDTLKDARQILLSRKGTMSESDITVYLTGEYASLPYFYDYAKEAFNEYKVLIGDPKNTLKISDQRFVSKQESSGKSVPFSVFFTNAIGLAKKAVASKMTDGVNLLPSEMKKIFKERKINLAMTISIIFMTIASLFVASVMSYQHVSYSFEISRLEIEQNGIERLVYGTRYQSIKDNLASFNQDVARLKTIEDGLVSVPQTLEIILNLVPENVTVSALDFRDDKMAISLNGIAADREHLLMLQSNMQEAEQVMEVIFPISNFDEKVDISFSMEILLDSTKLPDYASEQQE